MNTLAPRRKGIYFTAMKKSRYYSRYCKYGRYICAIPTVLHYLPPYLPLHILFYNIYLNIYLFCFWHHTTYLFSHGVWTFLLLWIRYYYIYRIIYPLFFKLQYLSTFLHFRNAYYHIHRNIYPLSTISTSISTIMFLSYNIHHHIYPTSSFFTPMRVATITTAQFLLLYLPQNYTLCKIYGKLFNG